MHARACHMAGRRAKGAPRKVAVRALAQGVEACPHCHPECRRGGARLGVRPVAAAARPMVVGKSRRLRALWVTDM
ncbi:DUF6233 domain-containing protein [Streptomyces sp. CRN 30]|uniref:DUF6233 domain-containing protein n=1 Tax=Streptomyces sp. CRN 30 TaxID=3075613 RepID=UPI002A8044F1|nr:DUF6233 domain-containing protein [Streptomyces sp. CRN 30]